VNLVNSYSMIYLFFVEHTNHVFIRCVWVCLWDNTMKPFRILLLVLIIISGSLAALFHRSVFSWDLGHFIFKPFTTVLILFLAVNLYNTTSDHRYRVLILLGLFFGLIGDVFLMLTYLNESFFIYGMVAFFINQVFYTVALWSDTRFYKSDIIYFLLIFIYGAGFFLFIENTLGAYKIPVLLYMITICFTGWRAFAATNRTQFNKIQQSLIVFGALSFILSDSLLAINKFYYPLPYEKIWVLSTYYLAQVLFAYSIRSLPPIRSNSQ
jgi:uncharacterized membrane protein YhhN